MYLHNWENFAKIASIKHKLFTVNFDYSPLIVVSRPENTRR